METLTRQVSRRLHEEHQASLALWTRVEASLAAGQVDAGLMRTAAASLAEEIERHFAFEETALFPRLAEGGEGDIAELLQEEHGTIRQAGERFIALVKDDPASPGLKPLGLELAERLISHVQKEEMSMLPALEDLLDEDTDGELALEYCS
ncbi:MAG TPA: hemerythrin domain-containing protein [Burkholderiales bacterium]|nr:hemerythrin domain-containing protein [Burkholderiales bacterium]